MNPKILTRKGYFQKKQLILILHLQVTHDNVHWHCSKDKSESLKHEIYAINGILFHKKMVCLSKGQEKGKSYSNLNCLISCLSKRISWMWKKVANFEPLYLPIKNTKFSLQFAMWENWVGGDPKGTHSDFHIQLQPQTFSFKKSLGLFGYQKGLENQIIHI